MEIDLDHNTVSCGGTLTHLPGRVAELLFALKKVYPNTAGYEWLRVKMWGGESNPSPNHLSVLVAFARKALEPMGWSIRVEREIGYRLVARNK